MSNWRLVSRIEVTVNNLKYESYQHQIIHILRYTKLCEREDIFELLAQIYDARTEENYFAACKRFLLMVKLIAPQVLESYTLSNKIETARKLFGADYYLAIPLREINERLHKVEGECDEFI